jgi:hypothetical protein
LGELGSKTSSNSWEIGKIEARGTQTKVEGVLKQQIHGQKLPKTQRIDRSARIKERLFLVEIFEFLKNKEKFGGFWWKHKSNPCQPRALIPYDVGLVPIFTDLGGGIDEHEEQAMNTRTQRGENTQSRITSK